MKKLLVVPALLLALAGCGTDTPEPQESPVQTLHANLKKVSERWAELDESEKASVCTAATTLPTPEGEEEDGGSGQIPYSGPNYRAMLNALMDTGLKQPEAAAMLPYAANKCL